MVALIPAAGKGTRLGALDRSKELLVVDEGRLVGLISRRDVMRALEAMEQALSRSGGKTTYELIDERHQKLD